MKKEPLHLVVAPIKTEPDRSDDFLMSRAAANDTLAFAELVKRHQQGVKRFCELLLRDPKDARDVAQDVFVRIWVGRDRYRPQGRFKELLFTAVRNQCRSLQRKRALWALLPFDLMTAEVDAQATPVTALEGALETEQAQLVAFALKRLPEQLRLPLSLRYFESMPYEEIARVIGRTPSTARSRVFYGLRRLAELLPSEVNR